ncbi:VIT1/CCC1 transporter family protein [Candidatus Roizmanbacteria bacterium]|nr:VIT1/CCC1 transporter family protein [Candidatus Roizmanbacteria bacterium]
MFKNIHEDYLRSIVFGFQDSLVSTTGVIAGVSVTITVESLSMGGGQYISEKSVHQMDKTGKHTDNLYFGALLMILSYFLGGLIPLLPVIALELPISITISIISALIGLFVLGFIKAKLVKVNPLRSAMEIFVLGGLATIIGLIVGRLFQIHS